MLLLLALACTVDHHSWTTATVSSISADQQGFYAVVDRTTHERTTWSGGESTSVEDVDGVIVRCLVSGESVNCRPLISADEVAAASTAPVVVGPSTAPSVVALSNTSLLLAQLWADAGRAHMPIADADVAAVYGRQTAGATIRDLREAAKAGLTMASTSTMDEILTAGGIPHSTAGMVAQLYTAAGRTPPKDPAVDAATIDARLRAGQTWVEMIEAAKRGGKNAVMWAGLDAILTAGGLQSPPAPTPTP